MSLYDRLTNKLGDDEEPSSGLTPLDIADLPGAQRKVMFSMLRDTKAATEGISPDRLSEKLDHPDDLEQTLAELVKNGWLIAIGEESNLRYKVNIQRKRSSSLGFGIWSSLSDRITQRMTELEADEMQPKRRSALPTALQDDTRPNTSSEDTGESDENDAPEKS